jgi:hypothetical protein
MREPLLLLFLLCSAASASDSIVTEIKCPDSIRERPVVETQADGWDVVAGEPGMRPLDKVGVYLSHPSQNDALVPDSTKRTKTEERVTWQLVRGQSDEFWVGCTYQGTTAVMAKRLGQDVGQCVASYQLLPSGSRLRLIGMSCKRL